MTETIWLESLDLSFMKQGWLEAKPGRAVTGNPLRIAGIEYAHGVGTHARSVLWLDLAGGTERFQAAVGLDDAAEGQGSAVFKVYGDSKPLFDSGVMTTGQPAIGVDIDLNGVNRLVLTVGDAGNGIRFGHANWADARFAVKGTKPAPASPPPPGKADIRTPPPGPAPLINGPHVYGCRPGHPFLYRIPATGIRPLSFGAEHLPAGLRLDRSTGIITGAIGQRGEYTTTLSARNAAGSDRRTFRLVCGDTLALTPPMGWNDWYAHTDKVTDGIMRQAADAMVASGMADFGYQYVSIDDGWMNAPKHADADRVGPLRDRAGRIQPNRHFPDMKALADYIHGKGLKFGIYSSPGPLTCAGFAGSFQHEEADARQYEAWAVDLVKYDWCTYWEVAKADDPKGRTLSREDFIRPYRLMGALLQALSRDVVFNLCQYGMCNVWEWAPDIGGHTWRTTGDVGLERNEALPGALRIGLANARLSAYAGPGRWNDPDYLILGTCPGGPELTPDEQYAYVSMWALMAAPLFFSGDISRLDAFTINLLCNREIIAVNQDSLGRQAAIHRQFNEEFILTKPLADGRIAIGLFNLGEVPLEIGIKWADLGISGNRTVRDLWRQKDLGTFADGYSTVIGRHGAAVVTVMKEQQDP